MNPIVEKHVVDILSRRRRNEFDAAAGVGMA
jgi:hypothetical protein